MIFTLQKVLQTEFYSISIEKYLIALSIFVLSNILFKILKKVFSTKNSESDNKLQNFIYHFIKTIPNAFYLFICFYLAAIFLMIPIPKFYQYLNSTLLIVILIQFTSSAQQVINIGLNFFLNQIGHKGEKKNLIAGINLLLKIIIWTTVILLVLSNLGLNVSTLIASFGIGGIAVALALQNIFGDVFSSFSIYFDRPFEVGDFVKIDKCSGTIKTIGLKTTRLTSVQGEEIVLPNIKLTNAQIQNFKKMEKRRVNLEIRLDLSTSEDQITTLNKELERAIKEVEKVEFSRVHFFEIGPYSLNLELVYFITSKDYKIYMDARQEINFKIMKAIEKANIQLAKIETVALGKE